MPRRLEPRIVALETQVAVGHAVAILVGDPSEAEIGRLHAVGVEVVVTIPDNGRGPGAEQWQRSRPE